MSDRTAKIIDVAKMLLEGVSAGDIQAKHPEAYAKYVAGFGTQKRHRRAPVRP